MINGIKSIIKRCGAIYRPLKKIKSKIVTPLRDGHFAYYSKYRRGLRAEELARFDELGFSKTKPVMIEAWRIGKGKDGAERRYYTAVKEGARCFIKVGSRDATVVNELRLLEYINSGSELFPKLAAGTESFGKETAMLAINYVEGLHEVSLDCGGKAVLRDMVSILEELERFGIVHADIHKGNLMYGSKGPILLDFGISRIMGRENEIDYNARPGTYFVQNGGLRTYNDAYSCLRLLEELGADAKLKSTEEYKRIEGRLCGPSFTVKLD
ncbi:MAG: hypothetical protein II897_00760 [Clostridia bacterium]|nr:hypothetical protein [Clostridia bacterium]